MNTDEKIVEQLWALEANRHEAMTTKDVAALERLLDDDLIYVHSTGRLMTKGEYLDHVKSDDFAYLSIVPATERQCAVSSQMVMLVQQVEAAILLRGKRVATKLSVTAIWRLSGAGWKLVGSAAARVTA